MDTTEILLIVNSALLSLIGVLFVVIGFFLKDFHKDFKQLVDRVNQLWAEHNAHTGAFALIRDMMEGRIRKLSKRMDKLEAKRK